MTKAVFVCVFAALVASGCATRVVHVDPASAPDDFEMLPARWTHDLALAHLGGKRVVVSSVSEGTIIRYEVLIEVPKLGVRYETTQRSPDGTETETLSVTLRAGKSPDEFRAEYDHIVALKDGSGICFSGKTVLPR